jgi:REP element-mobilizing transposase RayT
MGWAMGSYREHLIIDQGKESALFGFMRAKAHDLDAYIEEMGGWRDHVHLLMRIRPTIALADVYRQLKGFSSRAWHTKFPDAPFGWADGVFAVTVNPYDCDALRSYIRNQHAHHDGGKTVAQWEPEDGSP